ncbi:MAG: CcoQ/FixQ family Cbb3-type cytochrome c oxidase assembly chaperone [Flavobacteriales bacterium]|nr:CcoQ/FixQ family Cbb3-type cytochrome c oxidase assembly chaperone [Flavobacteriales bacterium]
MLKFVKQHMSTIDGVAIFPVIAFLLFACFFVGVLWWVWTSDRRSTEHMSSLPLDGPSAT